MDGSHGAVRLSYVALQMHHARALTAPCRASRRLSRQALVSPEHPWQRLVLTMFCKFCVRNPTRLPGPSSQVDEGRNHDYPFSACNSRARPGESLVCVGGLNSLRYEVFKRRDESTRVEGSITNLLVLFSLFI